MYQYDDPTCAAALPAPAAGGTPGYFTDGNPVGGVAATELRSDFMNMLMMELLNVVSASGQTPSKTTYNQVLTAIQSLISASSNGRLLNVQIFTSSGTYTNTPGTKNIVVEAVGGGGGGGACPSTTSSQQATAGGGTCGAYAMARYISGFTGGLAVTIGAAGSGGATGSNVGGSGGTTSLGSILSCPGGLGGTAGIASSTTTTVGAPGLNTTLPTVTSGTLLKYKVRTTGVGQISLGITSGSIQSGGGGSSPFGDGGVPVNGAAGIAGVGYGAGGSGCSQYASEAGSAGGAGTAGYLIVYEYA